jgi:hypothetical protein
MIFTMTRCLSNQVPDGPTSTLRMVEGIEGVDAVSV